MTDTINNRCLLKIFSADVWSRILNRLDEIHLRNIRELDSDLSERYYKTYRLPWICRSVFEGMWSKMASLRMNTGIKGKSSYYCQVHKCFENITLQKMTEVADFHSGFYCHRCKNHCFSVHRDNLMCPAIIVQNPDGDNDYMRLCINCLDKTGHWECVVCENIFLDTVPSTRGEGEPEEVKRCLSAQCAFQYKLCTCEKGSTDESDEEEICWICQGHN